MGEAGGGWDQHDEGGDRSLWMIGEMFRRKVEEGVVMSWNMGRGAWVA